MYSPGESNTCPGIKDKYTPDLSLCPANRHAIDQNKGCQNTKPLTFSGNIFSIHQT